MSLKAIHNGELECILDLTKPILIRRKLYYVCIDLRRRTLSSNPDDKDRSIKKQIQSPTNNPTLILKSETW